MNSVVLRTVVPILLLIGAGFSSRKFGLLQKGDQRVLSSYIFYFALPALLLVNMSEIPLDLQTFKFVLAVLLPHFIALALLLALFVIIKFSINTLYLLIVCSVFGSHSFFGLPFVMFAFDTKEAERLAVLSSSFIAISAVCMTITVLEMYKVKEPNFLKGIKKVLVKLSRNPLIIAIFSGVLLSALGITIPLPISRPLEMLGKTAATVAIFQLGVSLYGRKYTKIKTAFQLSLIRMLLLPLIALGIISLFQPGELEGTVMVLMHATPMAMATIVLSERYQFYEDTILSLMLISSVGAAVYMNVWLYFLGYH